MIIKEVGMKGEAMNNLRIKNQIISEYVFSGEYHKMWDFGHLRNWNYSLKQNSNM